MIMVLGPHKKKTEAMAEAREAQAARKAEAKANPGKSQNAAESEFDGEGIEGEVIADEDVADEVETVEAPAEARADA